MGPFAAGHWSIGAARKWEPKVSPKASAINVIPFKCKSNAIKLYSTTGYRLYLNFEYLSVLYLINKNKVSASVYPSIRI